jgi:hypothetical protein
MSAAVIYRHETHDMCDDCRKKAAEILEELRGLQAEFWSKLSEFESVLQGELESTTDFRDYDLDHFILSAALEPKPVKKVSRVAVLERERIGNTPTCEDCGESLDHCICEDGAR